MIRAYLVRCQISQSVSAFLEGCYCDWLLNFSPEKIEQISDKSFALDHIILDTNFILRLTTTKILQILRKYYLTEILLVMYHQNGFFQLF